jgi:uracil-DNA glycosylase family 4
MSVDDQGRLVPRRVTGWHATPLGGRTVHRLTYRSATRAGAGRVGIELTGDHPVLTERGYVRADELTAGDRVATGQAPSRRAARDVAQDRVVAAVGGGEPSLDDGAARAGDAVPVAFDDVEVEDVTDRTPGDATVFCIDVEDTHNFVTAGGVVHNCRPPGNRDPAPVEIENCQEYLLRQVELIQPKVICTLGNFSTKLLRGDPTGITRVHGRRERRVFGTRAVWLYPIHHPAAALYTRSLQDTLREDFARLPAILAGPPPEQPDPEPEPEPEPGPQPEPEATASPDLVEQRPADAVAEAPTVEQLGLF